jgi:hypothetical protein
MTAFMIYNASVVRVIEPRASVYHAILSLVKCNYAPIVICTEGFVTGSLGLINCSIVDLFYDRAGHCVSVFDCDTCDTALERC